jgi:hypothetical protein
MAHGAVLRDLAPERAADDQGRILIGTSRAAMILPCAEPHPGACALRRVVIGIRPVPTVARRGPGARIRAPDRTGRSRDGR